MVKFKLYNHQVLDLESIDKNQLSIDVLSHGMSNCCMFSNQPGSFFSVADHAIGLSKHIMKTQNDPEKAMYGLLLNAAEPFIPYYTTFLSPIIVELRENLEAKIKEKYNLNTEFLNELLEIEQSLIEDEINILFPVVTQMSSPTESVPSISKRIFMTTFNELYLKQS